MPVMNELLFGIQPASHLKILLARIKQVSYVFIVNLKKGAGATVLQALIGSGCFILHGHCSFVSELPDFRALEKHKITSSIRSIMCSKTRGIMPRWDPLNVLDDPMSPNIV